MNNYLQQELYKLIQQDSNIFDFIQNSALDGLWYWDLEKPEEEWMNKGFWTTLGYDPAEMPHKSSAWQDIIYQDDLKLAVENLEKHLADPSHPYDQVVRYYHKHGHTVWIRCRGMAIRENGVPKRMLGAHTDLSSVLKAQQLLEQCNTQAKIGYWEIDLETMTPHWSDETCRIHGEKPGFVPDLDKALEYYPEGEVRERISRNFEEAIQHGIAYEDVYQFNRADGRQIWVKAIGIPEMRNGKCVRMYGTFQDVDEQIRSKQQLEEQNKRLQNFAHIVSHNLRSHDSGLRGLLSLLESTKPELAEDQAWQLLKKASENLSGTLKDLTEVVKVHTDDSQTKEELNLQKVVQQNMDSLYAQSIKAGVQMYNEVDPQHALYTNSLYLNSAILNLLTNAIKYADPNKPSFVKVHSTLNLQKTSLCIHVEDNGLGIDLDKYGDRLLGMYKTFHDNKDARGVGLFITKNQIESLGGSISVQSKNSFGSTFTIEIPL